MDRFAAHVVATAVLTAALAAVPSALANPTSDAGPKASPTSKPSTTAFARQPAAAPSVGASMGAPASASASASSPTSPESPSAGARTRPIPCSDAHQVGRTVYARWHGMVAFSVKQFYSPACDAFYGYAFPWLQFRQLKVRYDVGMAVFDATHDAIDGARTFVGGAGGPDFWSSPVQVPKGTCTQGLVHVFFPDTETDTFTAKFCG